MHRGRDTDNLHAIFLADHRHSPVTPVLDHRQNKISPHKPSISPAYIQHTVSKFDTLPGLAIKYGVEVADIRKINGLVTDSQMFALRSLNIPLPGRHPPSTCWSDSSDGSSQGNDKTPDHHLRNKPFDSFKWDKFLGSKSPKQKASPAMSTLQGYYGLKPTNPKIIAEGCEMTTYRQGDTHLLGNGHCKARNLVNEYLDQNGESNQNVESKENSIEKLVRRRQKSEADFSRTPEMLLDCEIVSGGGFSATKGKSLAPRAKVSSRTGLATDAEYSDDFELVDGVPGVRKSSSTPSLQDQEHNGSTSSSSSIWPTTKWGLISDSQAISSLVIPRPGRRKTAVD